MELIKSLKFSFYVMFHPFDGFWELKAEKKGSVKAALIILLLLSISFFCSKYMVSFLFGGDLPRAYNFYNEIISVILPFVLWCIANWCLTTLMDGEGSFRDIVIATAYALVPIILYRFMLVIFSYFITMDEASFMNFFYNLTLFWSLGLLILGTMVTHQYTMGKNLITMIFTLVGMGLMIFIGLLFFSLLQQMIQFVVSIWNELNLRF